MIDLKVLTDAVGDLDEDKLMGMLNDFVASKPTEEEAQSVVGACQRGMAKVGELFESGEYFIGDLIFAGELLTQSIDILEPVIGSDESAKVGKIVLATVEGDLHDIGKNIFRSMSEAAGFEVFDLGIDQGPSAFIEKVKEVQPDVVGMSGVLTLALEAMKKTVDELKAAGVRDSLKIIIGGNPVTEEACRQIGADAFTTNAAEGVKICQSWVK
ncbi:corrinoid methyltransferase protein [Dehalobacter sp. UNSWDHB]|jgi:Predicted cobalamin binding protein|uniref:cobalamin B12-binding domain-containing protein n=1 Tax=unclassified Dehalobacter TaxID=2635733 RepID=UPI00028B6F8A|nr:MULTISPECIES: cobalamin-dependent protein [unclassified Dehalobacter]AFV01248.1 corrinoid methyltransferase protein [Dehalobacter sp. DCA]AFV04286.1 corrinoid methyltransferase protein [Dehalobacter sp. CF]EQB20172.1 corrinoid methyltransferase protein [Dehalobacter sp. UNSWDHB]